MNETMKEIYRAYFLFKQNKKLMFLVGSGQPGITATNFSQYVGLVNGIVDSVAPDDQFIKKYTAGSKK